MRVGYIFTKDNVDRQVNHRMDRLMSIAGALRAIVSVTQA